MLRPGLRARVLRQGLSVAEAMPGSAGSPPSCPQPSDHWEHASRQSCGHGGRRRRKCPRREPRGEGGRPPRRRWFGYMCCRQHRALMARRDGCTRGSEHTRRQDKREAFVWRQGPSPAPVVGAHWEGKEEKLTARNLTGENAARALWGSIGLPRRRPPTRRREARSPRKAAAGFTACLATEGRVTASTVSGQKGNSDTTEVVCGSHWKLGSQVFVVRQARHSYGGN